MKNEDKFSDFDLKEPEKEKQSDTLFIADAWGLLYRYKYFFAICLILSVAVGYIYIRTTAKLYVRTATVLVKDSKNGSGMMESQQFNDMMSFGSNSVVNEEQIFKSRRLMYRVAERLRLDVSYRAVNLKKTELYTDSPIKIRFIDLDDTRGCSMSVRLLNKDVVELSEINGMEGKVLKVPVGKIVNTPVGKLEVQLNPKHPIVEGADEVIMVRKAPLKPIANAFSAGVSVEMSGQQSSILNLSMVDENAQRAEDVLNTLIDVYNEDAIEDKNRVTNNTADFINERLAVIEKELDLVDSEIEGYKRQHRLTNLTSESNVFLNTSNSLNNEGLNIENQLNMTEYMKDYLSRNNKNSDMIPASIGIQDGGIQSQIAGYNELVTKRNKLLANSSEQNPLIRDMDETLKSHRRAILRAVDNLETSLKLQTMNTKNKERETYAKIESLPSQQKQIVSIERQQKVKEELYLYLLNKKEENELQQTIVESNCKTVDSADGPRGPISPNKSQVMLICLVVGLVVPALLLYMRYLLNTKVHVKEDIKDKLSLPFLGEVPLDKVKEEKNIMLTKGSTHEHLSEALRIVRENLSFMLSKSQNRCKVIQIISLNPTSGKTFIVINLGCCIAASGKRVLCIDLDLRKASLTRGLGYSTKQVGISNYLVDDGIDMDCLIHTVDAPLCKFDVIMSGSLPPNAAELLKSDRMQELINKMKERYDCILLDNPPFGIVADAFICSRLADQSVCVVRSGLFDKRLIPDLQELSDSGKVRHLGVLLNGVDYKKSLYNYKYGYGYGYGYKYGYHSHKNEFGKARQFFQKLLH